MVVSREGLVAAQAWGALFIDEGEVTITNSLFIGNQVISGDGDDHLFGRATPSHSSKWKVSQGDLPSGRSL